MTRSKLILLVGIGVIVFFSELSAIQRIQTSTRADTFKVYYTTSLFFDVDQRDAMVAIDLWTKEIGEQMDATVVPNSSVFSDIDDVMAAYLTDDIDMVVFTTQEFMQVQGKKIFEPALVGSQGDNHGEEMVLLVHKESGIGTLEQLRGKTLKIPMGTVSSTIVMMWLETLFHDEGIIFDSSFFKEIHSVNKPAKAVLPVFFRQAECCIVSQRSLSLLGELNPQMEKDLIVLVKSPSITRYVFCFNKDVDTKLKRMVLDKALTLDSYARGQQLLTLFKLDRVIQYDPRYLDSVHHIFNRVNSNKMSFLEHAFLY